MKKLELRYYATCDQYGKKTEPRLQYRYVIEGNPFTEKWEEIPYIEEKIYIKHE